MEPSSSLEASPKLAKRLRVGIRGLLGLVLLVGLALGWFAWQDRLARLQTARLKELEAMGVHENDFRPTILCFAAMKVLGADSRKAETKLGRWLDPGWFSYPRGFNAGMLPDDRVATVVEKVGRFGAVKEVRFDRPPLVGLRLFYIDRVPYERLGVPKDACTYTDHPASPDTRR